jgi:hypothetical protein
MDIEKNIEFILSQQAEFVADIHLLQEGQRALQESQRATDERLNKLIDVVKNHGEGFLVVGAMYDRLAARLDDFVDRQGWLFEGQKSLLEAQARTEATVGRLADVLERFIDEVRRHVTGKDGHST